jgi:MYXO-CTERM domain-containing protein
MPSALAENKTFRVLPFQFAYQADPDANFTMDMVSVRILMHAASDPGSITKPQDFMFHFVPDADAHHDHSTHEHGDGDDGAGVPGFDVVVLAAGALAAAVVWRRR